MNKGLPTYIYGKLSYDINEYGCKIKTDGIELKMTSGDIYNLLMKLKKDSTWRNVINRIITADDNICVGKGSCPFPFDCKQWLDCDRTYCNADVCINGYAYRMS